MKQSLKLGPTRRKTLSFSTLMPAKIEVIAYNRVLETGTEEFSDITNKFEEKYEVLDTIGEGTTCLVKRCIDKATRKTWSAKIVRTNDIEVIKAIKTEFLILKSLSHPNIVKVHEMFYNPINSRIRIVMELYEGSDLFDYIMKNGYFYGIF